MFTVTIYAVSIFMSHVYSAKLDINAIGVQTFKGIDTNHDGTLQEGEMSKAIGSFDANGDNVVSCQEYISASTLSQAVSRKIYDFYDNECSCHLKQIYIKSLFLGMDDDSDNLISQKEFTQHFTEVLKIIEGTDPQSRQIFNCQDLIFMALNAYKTIDTDHDGNFSVAEQDALVTGLDADGDNNVTCNEYILASSFPRNLSRYIFFHFDQESNGDCSLTHDELVKILGGMDTDGDKAISQKEFQTKFIKVIKLMQHGNQQPQGQGLGDLTTLTHANFAGIDTNTNGQIDNSEWDSVITALDLDGDKNVTCHEYFTVSTFPLPLSRAIFLLNDADGDCSIPHDYLMTVVKNMDGNGDGLVSEAEFKTNLQQIAQALQSQSS